MRDAACLPACARPFNRLSMLAARYRLVAAGSPNQPVEISATPLSGGDVSLYVNNVVSTWSNTVNYPSFTCHPTICPTTWSVANAPFTSVGSYSRERVLITPSTPGFTVGMYVIGVLSLGNDASFSVVASVGGSSTVLTPGIPILDSVSRDGYNYYQVPFNTFGADLSVTVTPFNGDPDLFSSLTIRTPNSTTAAKRSMGGAGQVDAITWQWRELAPYYASGSGLTAYFSVYGYRNSSYSIVATAINGTTPTYLGASRAGGRGAVARSLSRRCTAHHSYVVLDPHPCHRLQLTVSRSAARWATARTRIS